MRATAPGQFPALSGSDWNGLRCLHEAIPDLLEQLQAVRDTKCLNFLSHGAHDRPRERPCLASALTKFSDPLHPPTRPAKPVRPRAPPFPPGTAGGAGPRLLRRG